jgi:flagellar basal-body rod protein FlgC
MPKPVGLLPAAPPIQQPMFRSLAIAASGLSGQRQRMETIASNIANAETTNAANGQPYKRRVTVLAPGAGPTGVAGVAAPGAGSQDPFNGVRPFDVPGAASSSGSVAAPSDDVQHYEVPVLETNTPETGTAGVHVAGIAEDTSEGPLVYDPGHPDADKNGYVRYPNVRVTDEMVDMMDARRVYEANASVFQSAKAMLRQALDI